MFICNIKINSKNIVKVAFIIMSIIITIFFLISIYKILLQSFKVRDEMAQPEVSVIEANNYTNVLKSVYENLDNYVGQSIGFTGYVYRNSDFKENEFVLARDMKTSRENETLIVGFLCSYKEAKKFEDGTWVEITGTIEKGDYHGEIPILKITKISIVDEPENSQVSPPDDTYIPTAVIY